MSILNDDYFIDIYLNNRQSTLNDLKEIVMYNTDRNIATFKIGLFKESQVPVEKKDAKGFQAKLTILRYATNSTIELDGELDTDTDYVVYIFKVPEDYLNRVGKYGCEATIINNDESVTFNHFDYIIKESILTNLNDEIETDPDLPILKQLIEEVKSLGGGSSGNVSVSYDSETGNLIISSSNLKYDSQTGNLTI